MGINGTDFRFRSGPELIFQKYWEVMGNNGTKNLSEILIYGN